MSAHAHEAAQPSRWIVRFASLIRDGAHVLDVASGRGRHARWLAARGLRVVAVDRDASALESLRDVAGVETRVVDLEQGAWPLAGERFDAIVVANYLHRPAFGPMLDGLTDDAVLLYETFAAGNEAFGRPSNPAFLLRPGELYERVRDRLVVVAFEQGRVRDAGRDAVVPRVAAVGRAYAWPPALACTPP